MANVKRLFANWLHKKLADTIRNGGDIAPDEQAKARSVICHTLNDGKPCEYLGTVRPTILFSATGCTKCKCPLEFKSKTLQNFSYKEKKNITTSCPHPNGNKWHEVDDFFKQISND